MSSQFEVNLTAKRGIEELSIEQPDGSNDKYGIRKIYPDATEAPELQYLDMNNIMAGRIDDYPVRCVQIL